VSPNQLGRRILQQRNKRKWV